MELENSEIVVNDFIEKKIDYPTDSQLDNPISQYMELQHPEIMENAHNNFYLEKAKSYYGNEEDDQ